MKQREFWCQVLLRMKPELDEMVRLAGDRTGLKTQELLREAIRLGLPLIENKVI
ncbi:MAG: hypothetical protein WCD70_14895 [Alphaproteobacteria bacterium]